MFLENFKIFFKIFLKFSFNKFINSNYNYFVLGFVFNFGKESPELGIWTVSEGRAKFEFFVGVKKERTARNNHS